MAWSVTSTARRCRSRAATPWTRLTGWTGSEPTRPASPSPAAPPLAAMRRSARTGRPAEATRGVLGFVLDQMLRLLHPVMPYVTDELWTALISAIPRGDDPLSTPREGDRDSVMVAAWPSFSRPDAAAEAEIASVMRL